MLICGRCESCYPGGRAVMGRGPRPARVMAVGEAPGEEEHYRGVPFVGKAGMELDGTYLVRAGLRRRDVYVTNAVKCRPPDNRTPTPKEVVECAGRWLAGEVAEVQPEHVVLLGATACRVAGLEVDLNVDHGIPRRGEFWGRWVWLWPMYHPAAGLHEPRMMQRMLEDWVRVDLDKPERVVPVDEYGDPGVYEVGGAGEAADLLDPDGYDGVVAVDTERDGDATWSVQWAVGPYDGYFAAAANTAVMAVLARMLPQWPVVLLHNAGQDLDALEQVGVVVPNDHVVDTMSVAYRLGNQPQGLKALGWRRCGRRMRSWEDVVMPPSRRQVVEWCRRAEEGLPAVPQVGKRGQPVKPKPNPLWAAVRRIARHTPNDTYDPWAKWGERPSDERVEVEAVAGVMPTLSIRNVERGDAVRYGVEDAVMTWRVWVELTGDMVGRTQI